MAIHYQHSRRERDREISRRLSYRNGLRAVSREQTVAATSALVDLSDGLFPAWPP